MFLFIFKQVTMLQFIWKSIQKLDQYILNLFALVPSLIPQKICPHELPI